MVYARKAQTGAKHHNNVAPKFTDILGLKKITRDPSDTIKYVREKIKLRRTQTKLD